MTAFPDIIRIIHVFIALNARLKLNADGCAWKEEEEEQSKEEKEEEEEGREKAGGGGRERKDEGTLEEKVNFIRKTAGEDTLRNLTHIRCQFPTSNCCSLNTAKL